MQYELNSYGTNRDKKRKKYYIIIGMLALMSINFCACNPDNLIPNENKPPFIVDDWPEATDTIITSPDSVRDMNHADSIRFGLIPPEG